jgi:hypothetical protein
MASSLVVVSQTSTVSLRDGPHATTPGDAPAGFAVDRGTEPARAAQPAVVCAS